MLCQHKPGCAAGSREYLGVLTLKHSRTGMSAPFQWRRDPDQSCLCQRTQVVCRWLSRLINRLGMGFQDGIRYLASASKQGKFVFG